MFNNIGKLFTAPGSAPARDLDNEQERISTFKEQALAEARTLAARENRRTTLEDYRNACVELGKSQNLTDKEWNPKIYADLGGRDLRSFLITEPAKQQKQLPANKRELTELMDLDGDHAISDFYTNLSLVDANLNQTLVDPATSFQPQIAEAGSHKGMTFNNMENGDRFVFAAGQYEDINLTNVRGGEIVFASGTQVSGINVQGTSAAITVEPHAIVDHLQVNDHFRIIKLDVGEGAIISNSDLQNATISMASNLRGSIWQNVQLGGGNLDGVDFSGVTLKNLKIDGEAITSTKQLEELGVVINHETRVSASADFVREAKTEQALAKAAEVAQQVKGWMAGEPLPQPSPTASPTKQDQAPGVNTSLGHYEAMNKDIAKAPEQKPEPQSMDAILASLGEGMMGKHSANTVTSAPAKPENAAQKAESYDMAYFARMSERGGRA